MREAGADSFRGTAPYRERPAYRYALEDSVYVHPDYIGRGTGRALLEVLIETCTRAGYRQLIAVIGDKFWPLLCSAVGLDHLADNPRLRTNRLRTEARSEVDATVEEAVARFTTAEALERLRAAGVPHAPLNSVLQAVSTSYVQESEMVAEVPTPEGNYRVVQGPLRSGGPPRPAPNLGEHSDEILSEVKNRDSTPPG